jgi:hypothetical protein
MGLRDFPLVSQMVRYLWRNLGFGRKSLAVRQDLVIKASTRNGGCWIPVPSPSPRKESGNPEELRISTSSVRRRKHEVLKSVRAILFVFPEYNDPIPSSPSYSTSSTINPSPRVIPSGSPQAAIDFGSHRRARERPNKYEHSRFLRSSHPISLGFFPLVHSHPFRSEISSKPCVSQLFDCPPITQFS